MDAVLGRASVQARKLDKRVVTGVLFMVPAVLVGASVLKSTPG